MLTPLRRIAFSVLFHQPSMLYILRYDIHPQIVLSYRDTLNLEHHVFNEYDQTLGPVRSVLLIGTTTVEVTIDEYELLNKQNLILGDIKALGL